jgi:hypothetical protein
MSSLMGLLWHGGCNSTQLGMTCCSKLFKGSNYKLNLFTPKSLIVNPLFLITLLPYLSNLTIFFAVANPLFTICI